MYRPCGLRRVSVCAGFSCCVGFWSVLAFQPVQTALCVRHTVRLRRICHTVRLRRFSILHLPGRRTDPKACAVLCVARVFCIFALGLAFRSVDSFFAARTALRRVPLCGRRVLLLQCRSLFAPHVPCRLFLLSRVQPPVLQKERNRHIFGRGRQSPPRPAGVKSENGAGEKPSAPLFCFSFVCFFAPPTARSAHLGFQRSARRGIAVCSAKAPVCFTVRLCVLRCACAFCIAPCAAIRPAVMCQTLCA